MRIALQDRVNGLSTGDQVYAALRDGDRVAPSWSPAGGSPRTSWPTRSASAARPSARRSCACATSGSSRSCRSSARSSRSSAPPPSPTPRSCARRSSAPRSAAPPSARPTRPRRRCRPTSPRRSAPRAGRHRRLRRARRRAPPPLCDLSGHEIAWTLSRRANGHLDRVRRLSLPEPGYLGEMVAEHRERRRGGRRPTTPTAPRRALRHHLRMVLSERAAHPRGTPRLLRGVLMRRSQQHRCPASRRTGHAAARALRADGPDPRLRDRGRAPVQGRPHRRLLPPLLRPGGDDASASSHALQPDDLLVTGYRSHGFALARGILARGGDGRAVRPRRRLRARPRRLDAPARRRRAATTAAGASSPASCRSRPASRSRSCARASRRRCVCELGDGAVNMGAWHESLNLAALWKLPIVFLVVNNEYGMGTAVDARVRRAGAVQARERLPHARRARRRRRPRRGPRGGRPAAARARARSARPRCSRRSPTATAATRSPTPASPTAPRTRSPSTRRTTRSARVRAQLRERASTEAELRRDRRARRRARRRPRSSSRSASPEPRRRPSSPPACTPPAAPSSSRACGRAAPFGEEELTFDAGLGA